MSTNTDTGQQQDNKVSIYDTIIRYLNMFYVDTRRNIALLSLCLILPTVAIIAINYSKSNVYRSSFTIVYEELVRKIYGDRIKKLNTLLQTQPEKAQELLGLDDDAAKSLTQVYATNILGEDLSQDLNIDKIPFVVHININDTGHIHAIQNSIVNFLEEGNSYLATRKELAIQEIENELSFIDKQLSMLDTLKRKYNGTGSNTTGLGEKVAFGSAYEISYELYKKKQELIKKREMPMNLYVIDDVLVPVENNRSYLLMIAIGLTLGFVIYLGLIYLVIPVIRYKA